MKRNIVEHYYKNRGLYNYQLQNIEDILFVHGINILETIGYDDLADKNKEFFNSFIVNFYNAWGLEARSTIYPVSIHYVCDIERLGKENDEDDVYVTLSNEIIVMKCLEGDFLYSGEHLKDYKSEDYKHLECIDIIEKYYLRFAYRIYDKVDWQHVNSPTEWY